ncbi:hypothetical protein HHI36_015494 [Cryptolaemus montrouzieri]|uniref:Slowpoke-binding protein n=1 Tax=Cryptolaemus montrouzieri TaxID=559131 RepID=A0ABD2N791_9CUCU
MTSDSEDIEMPSESEEEVINEEPVNPEHINIGDFLLIKFEKKKTVIHYIAKVVFKYSVTEYEVLYLRKKQGLLSLYFQLWKTKQVWMLEISSVTQKHEYSALKTDGGGEKYRLDKQVQSGVFMACKQYLANNDRYELNNQMFNVGSRVDRHWFTVQDNKLGAERLLMLLPLPSTCPIIPNDNSKKILLELFRGLQHPYIHPILDVEFWEAGIALITPLNPDGSLRDLIYKSPWEEEYSQKYMGRGEGLPLRMIQCLGRQILEGLLFLRNREFPAFHHLHSGNVIIQNGVARLAGLENTLFNLTPRSPSPFETIAFGYLLFEMAAGYELAAPPNQAHLQLELERYPKVAEALDYIFQNPRPPTLEEVIFCELFRLMELRELRGATITQNRLSNDVQELLEIVRNPVPPSPVRRRFSMTLLHPGWHEIWITGTSVPKQN